MLPAITKTVKRPTLKCTLAPNLKSLPSADKCSTRRPQWQPSIGIPCPLFVPLSSSFREYGENCTSCPFAFHGIRTGSPSPKPAPSLRDERTPRPRHQYRQHV